MRKRNFLKATVALAAAMMVSSPVAGQDMPYNLLEGKPFEGTKLNILSVVILSSTG